MRKLLILIILSAAVVVADDDIFTASLVNGRAWVDAPQPAKTFYLMGVLEGLTVSKNTGIFPSTMTVGEISKTFDSFYSESTNLIIPLTSALSYARSKAEGASDTALKELETKMRKESFDIKRMYP